MNSLVNYGSDDENESDRFEGLSGYGGAGGSRKKDDDTNYDDVNMDLSEDSQGEESEPELPQAEPDRQKLHKDERHECYARGERDRGREQSHERREDRRDDDRRERRREPSPRRREPSPRRDRVDRRSPRPDDKYRSDRVRHESGSRREDRRCLLGDKPDNNKPPSLMDLKPFGVEVPPPRSQDTRDAVSPRFIDRDRRDRDRDRSERDRGRDRGRDSRRSEEKRSSSYRYGDERHDRDRSRSKSRGLGNAYPPPSLPSSSSDRSDRRGSPSSGDYRPTSYKVNKKLEVMEKMGLQIKTPDGSMATAQQLRRAAGDAPPPSGSAVPSYYNPTAINSAKIMEQVQKRKLLWGNKNKSEAEEAAKWSGTRFAQDNDGKQVSKFMRLMGIKEPAAIQAEPADKNEDPIKKQEELFQAMQQQYDVARQTTHTMRGVGLGFQRH